VSRRRCEGGGGRQNPGIYKSAGPSTRAKKAARGLYRDQSTPTAQTGLSDFRDEALLQEKESETLALSPQAVVIPIPRLL